MWVYVHDMVVQCDWTIDMRDPHLQVMSGVVGMVNMPVIVPVTQRCVYAILVGPEGDICARECVYGVGFDWVVVYGVQRCRMDSGVVCGCTLDIEMFCGDFISVFLMFFVNI